jgi:hypothetical protein
VQAPDHIAQASRSRTCVFAISFLLTALASLLTFAVPARGEEPATTDVIAPATTVVEEAASSVADAEAPVAATTEPASVPSSTSVSTPPPPEAMQAVEEGSAASSVETDLVGTASESKATDGDATVIDTLAKTASETVTKAAHTATSESPTRTFDKAADTGAPLLDLVEKPLASTPVERVREAMGSVRILELTQSVTESIRALSEFGSPAGIDHLLAPQAPATRASTSPSGIRVVPSADPLAEHEHLIGPAIATDGREITEVAPSFLLAHTERDLARPPLSGTHEGTSGLLLQMVASDGYFDGASQGSGHRAPAEAPTPAPGSTQAAAGSSGSTFIPLAALLALLALAAPATGRRLGKAADFRPPVPFVCALERPG